jgi:carboxylesterase type B
MIETQQLPEPVNAAGVRATYINEKYGSHERNIFDIWLADSEEPTPLVIYIHGGGFVGGDKSRYFDSEDWVRFLDAGVSVAAINYRFMNQAPYGILASMNDSKRCLQYIRYNAAKFNIDSNRIACSGGSAGAGTSLWLAFSDDMADLYNSDPVLRESTTISCAGAFATQSTYDILRWAELLNLPLNQTPEEMQVIARAFGLKSADGVDLFQQTKIREELDFLGKMSSKAAPFFVYNRREGGVPTNEDELQHHPVHAKRLKEQAEKVGAEAIVYAPAIGIVDESGKDLVDFFLEKL